VSDCDGERYRLTRSHGPFGQMVLISCPVFCAAKRGRRARSGQGAHADPSENVEDDSAIWPLRLGP
jgi:hypothetical protein